MKINGTEWTWTVAHANVDGAGSVSTHDDEGEAISKAKRMQEHANAQGNPWGYRYYVRRTVGNVTDTIFRADAR